MFRKYIFIILVIPSIAIRRRTILKLGKPYSEMSEEFVNLEKAGVEFGYHNVLRHNASSMDLYQIYYEDIQNIEYDASCMMLTITGFGQFTVYDDFHANIINDRLSRGEFYIDSKYSFILATHDAEKIIEKIKEEIESEQN